MKDETRSVFRLPSSVFRFYIGILLAQIKQKALEIFGPISTGGRAFTIDVILRLRSGRRLCDLWILLVYPAHQSRHGARIAQDRRRFAASSPGNSSFAGSHFKDRCNLCAMMVRCPSEADR